MKYLREGTEPFDKHHKHAVLPGLKWTTPDCIQDISHQVELLSELNCWKPYKLSTRLDAGALIPPLHDFDFRNIDLQGRVIEFLRFADWLWELVG